MIDIDYIRDSNDAHLREDKHCVACALIVLENWATSADPICVKMGDGIPFTTTLFFCGRCREKLAKLLS